MVTYQELLQNQIIKRIEKTEKEPYVSFHQLNYKLDLQSAQEFLELKNTKYAVIAGYYAVLNSTLWFFAKQFNLKISQKNTGIHTNCLIVLEEHIKEKKLKEKIMKLLNEAKEEFSTFTTLKKNPEQTMPVLFKQSSEKRKKYTYYSEKELPKQKDSTNEAKSFLKNTVLPYVSILEKLK